MGLIQDMLRRRKERKEEEQRMIEMDRFEGRVEMKKLSNDERLLMRFQDEDRRRKLKEIVRKLKKRDDEEFWTGRKHNAVYAPNVFKEGKNIFKNHQSIMVNDKKQLEGGNMFAPKNNGKRRKQSYIRKKTRI